MKRKRREKAETAFSSILNNYLSRSRIYQGRTRDAPVWNGTNLFGVCINMLSSMRRSRAVIIGDPGVGKSQLLPDNSSATTDRKAPTAGYQFVNASFSVSLDPGRPRENTTKETNITVWEIGTAGRARDGVGALPVTINKDRKSTYDAVILVFDGTKKESYKSMWQRWAPVIPLLVASSYSVPFVVVAETHADKLSRGTLKRHRRAVEIDLYLAFENRFIYRQLDARDPKSRAEFWDQVAIQLRWQPQAERGKILVRRYSTGDNSYQLENENTTSYYFHALIDHLRSVWARLRRSNNDDNGNFMDLDEGDFEMI